MAQKCTKTENICANLTPPPSPTPLNCQKITKEITSEGGERAKAVMADL